MLSRQQSLDSSAALGTSSWVAAASEARPVDFVPNNSAWYGEMQNGLFENQGCLGFRCCGTHQRDEGGRRGLIGGVEHPDEANVGLIEAANERVARLIVARFRSPPRCSRPTTQM